MPLFEYAIVEMPKKGKKEHDEPQEEKLIIGPTAIVAKSDKSAAMKVTLEHADKLKKLDPERINIIVRPF